MRQGIWQDIRESAPLIHNITNIVVANFSANGLLAIGASPVMADAIEEVAEMAFVSDALVLNIGTLGTMTEATMIRAGQAANEANHPVVLDPVGVGATTFRRDVVERILRHVRVTVIRGNAGEIATLLGVDWLARGVDAGAGTHEPKQLAIEAAKRYGCVVVVTGKTDVASDGKVVMEVHGGTSRLTQTTGTGCLLSAVIGACLAVEPNALKAAVTALSGYGYCGEVASEKAAGPGDFPIHFLNALHELAHVSMPLNRIEVLSS